MADAAMISPGWVRMMARHNAWQNGWLISAITGLSEAEVQADRGLFFGSILATANHILWADQAWMFRLGAGPRPEVALADNTRLTPDAATWARARRATDARITDWAAGVTETGGEQVWRAGLDGAENRHPRATILSHIFLHQVHHRGQLHAVLTGLGVETGTTDLPFLPEDI